MNLILIYLGATFCNCKDSEVEYFIKNVACNIKSSDYFIFSVDSNTDSKLLAEAYDNIWLKGLAFNVFLFFQKTFNIQNFDSELFKYEYHWDESLSEVQISLTATKVQNFIFDYQEITIHPNDRFHVITSKKRSPLFYEKILKDTNFRLVQKIEHTEDDLTLYIAQAL